jgi:hypothetical protein
MIFDLIDKCRYVFYAYVRYRGWKFEKIGPQFYYLKLKVHPWIE